MQYTSPQHSMCCIIASAGVFADKILMEKCTGNGQRKRQAVGVSALTTATSGGRQFKLVIKAEYVISSAGTLHTPALLLRSKVTCRGKVGKNLRLHPATAVLGLFCKVRRPASHAPQGFEQHAIAASRL